MCERAEASFLSSVTVTRFFQSTIFETSFFAEYLKNIRLVPGFPINLDLSSCCCCCWRCSSRCWGSCCWCWCYRWRCCYDVFDLKNFLCFANLNLLRKEISDIWLWLTCGVIFAGLLKTWWAWTGPRIDLIAWLISSSNNFWSTAKFETVSCFFSTEYRNGVGV